MSVGGYEEDGDVDGDCDADGDGDSDTRTDAAAVDVCHGIIKANLHFRQSTMEKQGNTGDPQQEHLGQVLQHQQQQQRHKQAQPHPQSHPQPHKHPQPHEPLHPHLHLQSLSS